MRTRGTTQFAHTLWEQGVAVGQIAQRCRITREEVWGMARTLGWSSREPERLPERNHAPLAPTTHPVPVRRVPAGKSGRPE